MSDNRLKELQGRHQQLIRDAEAKYNATDGNLTEQENESINALLGQADEIMAEIDMLQRMQRNRDYHEEPAGMQAAHLGWRDAGPDEGNFVVDSQSWRELEFHSPITGRTESLRYTVPTAIDRKGYDSAWEAYVRFGFNSLGPRDRHTLTEGTDSAGGFLVPTDFHSELLKKIAQMAVIRNYARTITVSSDLAQWPRVNYTTDDIYSSPVRLTWTGESPTSTSHRVTDPTFGTVDIPVKTAMASMPISNNLIEDAMFDLIGVTSDMLAESFALGEDDVFLNGTGGNKPTGILADVDGAGPASVASGTAATLLPAGIIDLYYGLPSQYRRNAVFVMSSDGAKVTEKLVDTQGRYIISSLMGASLSTPQFDTIKGRPVLIDEFMPSVSTNTYPIIFGDLSGYIIPERVGFSVQRLAERYAEENLTVLLARRRLGGLLAEPYRVKVQKVSS